MGLQISRLGQSEWQLLRELRIAALTDAPDAFGQPLESALAQPESEWRSTARAAANGDRRAWFVARLDGRAVGLVQARRRAPHDCLVFSMWVSPAARREGVGRALLDQVDDWATGWGGRRVVLWVVSGNDGAVRFYERIGFEVMHEGADVDSGAAYGALAMSRPIIRRSAGG